MRQTAARRTTAPGRVVVVGAGLGGLAAAIRLRADGHEVTLLEREAIPGGRAGRVERDGFSFDTGPSIMTMPSLVSDLFTAMGERMEDHLTMTRLDPAYRAVFHDGSVLHIRGTVDGMYEEVRNLAGVAEADRFTAFTAHLERLYEAEYATFIDSNFDSALDLATKPAKIAELIRLGGFKKVANLVGSYLTDWRLQRMFTFQSMYAGMSPYEALGVYAVIAYMDSIAGVYAPAGGIWAISKALGELAERHGVEIRYGAEVARVTGRGKQATGVELADGEQLPADVVVLNPDLPIAYRDLLPPKATPWRVKHLNYSPSCVVVHLGLDRKLLDAAHHNIHFAADYQGSFDDILAGRMQRDPSWYVSVPTVSEPGLAPEGGEIAFVLVPTPNLDGDPINWTAQAPREHEAAIRRLEEAKYGPVGESVVTSFTITPKEWGEQGMAAGTPFAASHHFRQTGPFRPANVAPKADGVVFVGSSTTPGVGVPMVLLSGGLAAERVNQQLDARR
jgi:phytoene desaturase